MNIKDFLIIHIENEIDGARGVIRTAKKDIKILEQLKAETSRRKEKELLDLLVQDEELKKQYETLKEQCQDMQRQEIKKLMNSGKLKGITNGSERIIDPIGSDKQSDNEGKL